MRGISTFIAFAQLAVAAVVVAEKLDDNVQPHLLSGEDKTNSSLVGEIFDRPLFAIEAAPPAHGKNKIQWPLPDAFKRQAASCVNYCGISQSAPPLYCGCGQTCCPTGKCCSSAAGEICCGTLCCTNGATCVSNSCMARTVVLSITATSTVLLTKDATVFATAISGTQTIITTLSSVTVVTISSADVATSYVTVTSTMGAAKKARGIADSKPAGAPALSAATMTSTADGLQAKSRSKGNPMSPRITAVPKLGSINEVMELRKRQNLALTTSTRTVTIVTVTSTVSRTITSTLSARATITLSSTVWQTVTSVINAKRTTIATTTLVITPNTVTINGATTVVDSTISPGGSAPAGGSAGTGGSNQNANSGSGGDSGGLSTGAKAGIGAGVGGGALIIAFILGFCLWRRRKSKNEQNQEMIQNAVDSAMATHVARNSVPSVPPVSYYDGKHMSTSTYSAPPSHPTSPSPQIHAPQPGYVYPPPQGHGQPMYSTDPMNFPEAMGSQPRYNYSAPLYGTEVAGSPVQQRHELASINSPAPPQPSVPYSNLPEVRR